MKYSKWFWIIIGIAFLVFTHQVLWCPIHGDGAFYAMIIKQTTMHTGLTLYRANGYAFFDHPYLFFYYASLITKLFGVSDFTVKLPNFLMAGFTFYLMTKASKASHPHFVNRNLGNSQNLIFWAGIISILLLALTGGYELQTRQPSIDPSVQFLALAAVFALIRYRNHYAAGVVLGLAFMTKGTEMLSHLAALMLLPFIGSSIHESIREFLKNLGKSLIVLGGVLTVFALWFAWDRYFNIHWFEGYYEYQFKNRFFSKQNFSTSLIDLAFIKSLFQMYGIWLIPTAVIHAFYFRKNKSLPKIWIYYWLYLIMTVCAFSLIKKDSSQHYTGIYIFGSISLAQGLVYMWTCWSDKLRHRSLQIAKGLTATLFVAACCATIYFWTTPYNKKDIWAETQRVGKFLEQKSSQLVVINPKSPWGEQMYWNLRWYSQNPIYWKGGDERSTITPGQAVFLVTASPSGSEIEVREIAADSDILNK
ncbi:glycosyltransferase family 39 protein [Bdellovibrio sp. SKB1291214]|uniref:ArnT family glycosyltransferase n=1 Tax=Bdellovibrio sp. SKB1291214 TaxID=1732569 RepID=UPI000B51D54A|nr:glycosyltransferase family 39 protein [Bdellovibrio sp. SKB1291214]UYL08286.1 glycosyltransferase family 39 protein [Bdellovibrio sp. SKB1291214]